ncbi:hypothetical protein Lesp01_81760 [Lentzea sp. NBRC 102530]|nr:hypothetical protein Lesp01_81760 [Lentzea sp. NBRC 102530]
MDLRPKLVTLRTRSIGPADRTYGADCTCSAVMAHSTSVDRISRSSQSNAVTTGTPAGLVPIRAVACHAITCGAASRSRSRNLRAATFESPGVPESAASSATSEPPDNKCPWNAGELASRSANSAPSSSFPSTRNRSCSIVVTTTNEVSTFARTAL